MKLTENAKDAFLDYLRNNNKASIEIGVLRLHWQSYPKEYINALIIDWFDSIPYRANQTYWEYLFYYEYTRTNFLDYKKAVEKAIEKANELYNLENK